MTKFLVLATVIALGFGSASAQAREVDMLNLFGGLSEVSLHSLQRDRVIAPTPVLFSVRSQPQVGGFAGSDTGVDR
jgi:hypothetical protein